MNTIFKNWVKSLLCIVIFSFHTLISFAQKGSNCPEDLIPRLGENRRWGYVNFMGEWRIEPIYAKVSPFVENKAIVQTGNLMGVIDCNGNVILQCKYEKMTNFRNGKVWAMEKGLWGLLGAKGQVFQAPQFTEILPIPNTEWAWCKKDNLWGLFNEDRNSFLCKPQFTMVQIMSDTASLVQINQLYGVVNHTNCNYLIPASISKVKKISSHLILFKQNGYWGLFGSNGKIYINPEFDTIKIKNEDALEVVKNNKYGLYSMKGKKFLPAQYDEIGSFSGGFYKIKQNNKYGYCNRYGKIYIPIQFDDANDFSKEAAVVCMGKKYGIINSTGKYLLKPDYEYIYSSPQATFYAVREKNYYYLYSSQYKKMNNLPFDTIYAGDTSIAVRVSYEKKIRYYNIMTNQFTLPGSFDNGMAFSDGVALVSLNNKAGLIDLSGRWILPAEYEAIQTEYFQSKKVYRIVQNNKQGFADANGKIIIQPEYDLIATALPNYLKAKKQGKYGILRTNGNIQAEFVFDKISNSAEDVNLPEWPAIAAQKGKQGLINEKGEEVLGFKYKNIIYLGEGLYACTESKYVSLCSSKGILTETKYTQVLPFSEGLAPAFDKAWIFINTKAQPQFNTTFDDVKPFKNKLAAVKIKDKWGVINKTGKFIVPAEYDSYTENDNKRILTKNGRQYILLPDGSLQ
ncbi:MAG: WG repeat-containing protein [Cytophagaceae bacterium]|nr:WG repeat-containing protein [Cytophagaceae bacterium]MDW8457274.1 WG repeat-containing protein [Cytophagaceae bacterium]